MHYENPPRNGTYPEPPGPHEGVNRKWVVPGVIAVLLLGILLGYSGRGESATPAPAPAPTVTLTETALPVPAPTVTVTVTETASPEPAPAETTGPALAAETTEPAPAPEEETFKMPKVVGMNLQDAQDLLQSLDSYVMDQQDATGMDRWQVNDSNWKVCTQKPKAGKVVPISTIVELGAVKLSERCP